MTPEPAAPSTVETAGDPLAAAARLYLMLLPVGHLVIVPLGGTMATGADLALGGLLATGVVAEGAARMGGVPRPFRAALDPRVTRGLALLAAFGVWAALSGAWGYHPRYAVFKGVGYVALAAGAWLLAQSGGGSRLLAAWALGCVAALVVLVVGALGPEAVRGRVLYGAGAVRGLPLPRVSGPFLHPSMLGCYLAVSGALLWGLWPELGAGARRVARIGAAVGLFALALTVSTGWVSAGVAAILIGRDVSLLARRPRLAVALRVGGAAVAAGALVGVLIPLDFELLGRTIRTGAIRPAIWTSALNAVAAAPLQGVGASPYLALAPDPMGASELYVWDAHHAYLSVLGQFGVIGAALLAAGVGLIVRALLGASAAGHRARVAVVAALAGVAAHGFLVANEDFRHVWALLGIAGAVAAPVARPIAGVER